MDWAFYLIVSAGFFLVCAVILAIRYLLGERLAKLEKMAQQEREARKISESNSGL